MQGKITKRAVDGLAASGSAEVILWDTEVKGFGVRVRNGGGKSYILHYRVGGGRAAALRKLTIGKHGSPWTPETARAEARRLLGEVAAGHDPATTRHADRKGLTFNELIDLYLAAGASHKKASTLRVDRGRFEHHSGRFSASCGSTT
jgi:Arm DNA-binding domain